MKHSNVDTNYVAVSDARQHNIQSLTAIFNEHSRGLPSHNLTGMDSC